MRAPSPDRPVVYDTDTGRLCSQCRKPVKACACRQLRSQAARVAPRNDGIVRISRDRRNRKGKTVTVVTGVPGNEAALAEFAGTLKRLCGSGGTVREGVIEIQGDHRDLLAEKLSHMGYRVKLAGG